MPANWDANQLGAVLRTTTQVVFNAMLPINTGGLRFSRFDRAFVSVRWIPARPKTKNKGCPREAARSKADPAKPLSRVFGEVHVDASFIAQERRSFEGRAVLLDECLERHRRSAAELLDKVVGAGEDPVLMVDRDLLQVLHGEGIPGISDFPPSSPYMFLEDAPSTGLCRTDFIMARNASKGTCLYSTGFPSTRPRTAAVSS